MPLSADLVIGAVYTQHLVKFPEAVNGRRPDPADPTRTFNVNFEYISALMTALVATTKRLTVFDLSVGSGLAGVSAPTPFTFPLASSAVPSFLSDAGWSGKDSFRLADVVIRIALQQVAFFGRLQMTTPNLLCGVGAGVVAPVNNPTLFAVSVAMLQEELYTAFKNSGKFSRDDNPSNEPTEEILSRLPAYASAYAKGLASITASVAYTGTAGAASGGINIGSIS